MKFKAVIFDLDGTLLDTLEDLADSMNNVLETLGFPTHPLAAYRYFVGRGIVYMAEQVLPEGHRDEKTVQKCVAAMSEEYGKHWADKTRPYPGVPELLKELADRGVRMAVLSNKPDNMTRLTVSKLLPGRLFEIVQGVRPNRPKKPDPSGAFEISAQLRIPPEEFFYLGDTGIDMKTAVAARMFPAGALWGFRTKEELLENGAKKLLNKPLEMLEFF